MTSTTSRPRMVVLGLDGLPLDLGRRLAELHSLPHLARLAGHPRAGTVAAELPELSCVNWTSFFTAAGPESHGVYGFARLGSANPGPAETPFNYAVSPVSALDVRVPSIFALLGAAGRTCKVLNLPNAYPASAPTWALTEGGRFPGMLVAGFVAPDLAGAVHPAPLAGMLAGLEGLPGGYQIESDTAVGAHDPEALLDGLAHSLRGRRAAFELLWPDLAWDLFVAVLTETDRLFHFQLPAALEPSHPLHREVGGLLRLWDEVLGDMLAAYDALPGPKRLMVLADHGFAPLRVELDMNSWLARTGWLELAGVPADEWDARVVGGRSRALALDPGRIYVHDGARFTRGSVDPARRAEVARALAEHLAPLTREPYTAQGGPLLEAVLPADQLYGPSAVSDPRCPDLVCLARPGVSLTAKFDGRPPASSGESWGRRGGHTARGAFFLDTGATGSSRVLRMRDTGRAVLDFFGLA